MRNGHRHSGRAGHISFFRQSLDWLLNLRGLFLPGILLGQQHKRESRLNRLRLEPLEERHLLAAYPVLLSLNATNPPGPTTDASSVAYTATFSSPVTGVDATDFSPVPSGSVATTSIQVTPQSSSVYTVTIGGITGTGTLGLNLVDNGSIRDSSNNGLVQSNTPLSLSTQHVISVGASPNSVQVGDLDGDGNADLAVDNFNGATVSVMLGNGNGTFQTRQTYTVGTQPDWLAEADLNGDHKLDLVVANFVSNTVSVLLNNGNGTFQTQQTYSTGQHPSSVAIADFDRDGKLDLAVYNAIDKTVSILRGNGNGTFLPQTTFTPGMGGSSLITADFNGDHNPDLAITGASSNGSVVGILLGNGNGTFQPQTSYTTGTNSDWIAAGDVNGDGFLDLAATSETTKTATVFLGNGTGGFQAQPANSTGTMPTGIAISDINGDGKLDLVVSNELDNNLSVLLGNGNGSFQGPQNFTTGTNPVSVAVADFNSDGKPDLAVSNGASSSVSLFLNNANGTFAGQVYAITADHAPQGTNNSVTTLEDTSYTFATADFGFSDPLDSPPNNLAAVKISSLPTAGTLTDNNVAVTTGQFIPLADITTNQLKFTPASNANGTGYASFTFQVQDDGATSPGVNLDPTARTMTVNVTSVNDAPQGTSNTVTTLEDTPFIFATANFGFSDPNDSPPNNLAAVKITTLPAAGNLIDNNVAVTTGQFIPLADVTANQLKFTPASNANGTGYASFTFQVQDDGGTANSGVNLDPTPRTMTINVTGVNDAPQGTSNSVTTLEDTAFTFVTASFGFSDPNDSPPNNLAAVKIATLPTAGTLTDNNIAVTTGQFIPLMDVTANQLKFTPASNANGTGYASFTFQVQDDGGTANAGVNLDPTPRSMTINVTSVNDAPQGTSNSVTTLEDTAFTFVTASFGFSDPNDSPPNNLAAVKIATLPTAGTLTDNNVAVTTGQFIPLADVTGNQLKFSPASNANGTGYASFTFQVQDDGGTANGGVNLDLTPRTMTINVTSVNDAPQGTSTAVTTLEDTPFNFATASFGFSDPNDSPANNLAAVKIATLPTAGTLTDNNVAVTTGQFIPLADVTGNQLKFSPASNANGTGYASFTFQVQDDGGTANSGVNLDPTPRTMTINVTSVNDAPQGTSNSVTTLEDTPFTFATADFGFGDPNDSPANNLAAVKIATLPTAGTLTDNSVAVTTGQFIPVADVVANQLIFTPAANANGTGYSSFTFQVQDDGGTASGGVNLDPTPRTMTINVTPVNDAPVFTAGPNETVSVNLGLQTVPNWATAISAGPPDEAGQTLNFLVTNTNSSLFSTQPSISSTGTLTFTPAANATGNATVQVQLHDNGGTAFGGVDTSAFQTFTITVLRGFFDFDATSGPATTATGYTSVLGSTLYTGGLGYGWVTTAAAGFDRGGPSLLLRDGNYGSAGTAGARTFQDNLPNGSYLVNVTMGDASILRDQMQVANADTGAVLLSNINTPVGQFFQAEVPVMVSDGSLDLQFSDFGSDPYWVVNSLEIRPAASVIPVTFTSGPGAVSADGLSTDTINGAAAVPNGTILTVRSSLGTIVTDSSSLYTGNQVVVNGGTFSFQLTRPTATGTPTFTAAAIDGSAQGSASNPAVLNYQIAATRRFDFNGPSNNTAAGFIGVRGSNLYSASTGYGWNVAASDFERPTASQTTVALYRDGNYGSAGPSGARTFEIQVTPGATYGIRVYVGDASFMRDYIQVSAEGGASVNVPTTGVNQFTSVTLTGVDNGDGVLNVTIQDNGGDPYWVINGMDVALGGVGSLPGGAPLQVIGLGAGGVAAGPLLTSQALTPIVQEAIARWQAAGVGSQAVAMLQGVKFQIANLDGVGDLGLATPGLVKIDDNGDGYGWFVDPTPKTDVEFATKVAATELKAVVGSAASGRIDLLTVVMHELGHELGLTDLSATAAAHALMAESITTGVRRLPPAMTPAMVTPMSATAGLPLTLGNNAPPASNSVATDAVFATLASTTGSGSSLNPPPTSINFSTIQASTTPLRVETNRSALQLTLALTANSATISGGAPRKTASTVDAVFNLLGR